MKKLVSNKTEGTELFKGGNYVPAIERYVKALVHSSKFLGDLNQDEEKEVSTVGVGVGVVVVLVVVLVVVCWS